MKQVPGREFHPLESKRLSRRTVTTVARLADS